ncbi:right-handed parallel beta-helix repeat-containing protein [Duganella callida]|nr:right-handed parallel beta-helix repeat-containing protein [Duganella callida]
MIKASLMAALLLSGAPASHAAQARPPQILVDCSGAGAGTAVSSLADLNAMRFVPGTRILFKRGVTCHGSFAPRAGNSGTAAAPIVVSAYGDPAAGRPVIAAGCAQAATDSDQTLTDRARTPRGVSPYHTLCRSDGGDGAAVARAAIHLYNVDHWEIEGLELTNDGAGEGARVGLLVQLEDFGTGSHYRIRDVYVHHVRGYLKDAPGGEHGYKETGGILFNITRRAVNQRRTRFDDVVVENSEIFHVDAIGLSTRSAWMCRPGGAPCGDYPPYKTGAATLSAAAADEYTPSTNIIFRNNRIHDIGGDGIVVRTALRPLVRANLLHDIWLRAAGNSAGAWAINTDEARFEYNEIHHVRYQEPWEPGDGMSFDADLGTRGTHIVSNYSHNNGGGFMLFCGCGNDGLGHPAQASGTVVENNLSLNDGRRAIVFAGSQSAVVRGNLILNTRAGLSAPAAENTGLGSKNAGDIRDNVFYHGADAGTLFRAVKPALRHDDIRWSGNRFYGYQHSGEFTAGQFFEGDTANTVLPAASYDPDAAMRQWFAATRFRERSYRR